MFNASRQKSRYVQLLFLVSVLVLLSQVGSHTGTKDTASSTSTTAKSLLNTPRLASVNGAPTGNTSQKGSSVAPFEMGRSVKNDISPPLRTAIHPAQAAPWSMVREMPERDALPNNAPSALISDPVAQHSFGPAALAMPAPVRSFEGVNNRNGVYPPDTNGDAGPNHFVQFINLSFQIWDKNGVSLYGPANGNTIWSGFGSPCETRNDGDPVVLYDPIADRWLMSQFTSASPYGECIAISTTPDPTGSYYRYFFQFSTTIFYDYPHLGVWPDGYYMGANRFTSFYQGPSAIVFDRARMLQGQPATFQAANLSTSYGTLLPSDLDGPTAPPAGSPNFFASLGSNSLNFWKFHVDWATPSNSTFTGPTVLGTAAYNQLCPGTRSCVSQPNTSVGLDGLGDRLMHRLAYRNFGDHESLVVNHSVDLGNGQAGVRWYELRSPNSAPGIYQQGTYAPDATNRWLGSVAMNGNGDMALSYSASSSSVFPGIRYTGRLASDPLGTMPQGEGTLINGSGSQTGSGSRWGDYSMITVDPTDDCTFWFTTEYMPTTGTAPWQTRVGAFRFSSCGTPSTPTPTSTSTPALPSATPTDTPIPANTSTPTNTVIPTDTATPAPLTSTPTPVPPTTTPTNTPPVPDFTLNVTPTSRTLARPNSTSYTVNLTSINGFKGNVSLNVSGLPSKAAGSFSPNPVSLTSGATGSSTLTITSQRNGSTGTFTLTITGTSGGITHSQNVTLVITR